MKHYHIEIRTVLAGHESTRLMLGVWRRESEARAALSGTQQSMPTGKTLHVTDACRCPEGNQLRSRNQLFESAVPSRGGVA